MSLPSNIFNTEKSDYEQTPMFFGQKAGLYDTINKRHPQLFEYYKKLKKLDWDENDFSMLPCQVEFREAPPEIVSTMITTIAFQWGTDTVAARSVLGILLPFITDTVVHTYFQYVSANEGVHALAYSEIVRGSFQDPERVIDQILQIQSAQDRLSIVAVVFDDLYTLSHQYALGEITYSQELYNSLFKFLCALYVMESIQFMSSFAVTFAIGRAGWFMPIAQTVQKICQEEFEVHVKGNEYVLDQMLRTSAGVMAFNQCRGWLEDMISAVIEQEHRSAEQLIPEGVELVGLDSNTLKQYTNRRGVTVYDFFRIPVPQQYTVMGQPLAWMDDWINIGKTQGSPQETRQGQYMVGGIVNDLGDALIEMNLG